MSAHYDLIVVGGGLSAGSFLQQISKRDDLRILVVDRGALRDPQAIQHSFEYEALPRHDDTILFSDAFTEPHPVKKWWARDMSGGGSLTWYGQLSRFESSDFAMKSRGIARRQPIPLGAVRDWPIGIAELEPYYREVEAYLRPVGVRRGAAGATADCEIVVDRPQLSLLERTLIDELGSNGLRPYVGATCLGGRAWEQAPVDPMTGQGLPGCGLVNRQNWYSPTYGLVNEGSIEFLDLHSVDVIRCASGRAVGVEVREVGENPGPGRFIAADTIVMAASPIETVCTLLRSSVPDEDGHLGQGFTYSTELVSYVSTAIPRSQDPFDSNLGKFSNLTVRDFYEGDGIECCKGGKISIYDALSCEAESRHLASCEMGELQRAQLIAAECQNYILKLSFKGESIPWSGKFVRLASDTGGRGTPSPWVHYDLHPHDHAVRAYATEAFKTVAHAVPGGEVVANSMPVSAALISGHQHGGVIFGDRQSNSSLNSFCKYWSVEGLYVVDGSFMPTSGATNSSLTVSANAFRIADYLAETIPHRRPRY